MQAHAILFTGANKVELGSAQIPDPGPGDVLVEAHYTCVSPGTELRTLAGKQVGAGPFPLVSGYQCAGRVIKAGTGVTLETGTRVFYAGSDTILDRGRCWGGHISHAVVSAAKVFVLPDTVDLVEASIGKLTAIAYHGLRISRSLPHEKVAVIGLGPLGQLSARVHALTGARVVGADVSSDRVAFARASGLEALEVKGSLPETFAGVFPEGADLVVDVTGAPQVLPQSVLLGKSKPWDNSQEPCARLLLQGSYPDTFSVNYADAFQREMTLLTTRDQQDRDLVEVFDLLARKRLQVRDIISDVRPVARAPETFEALVAAKEGILTVAFDWQAG